MRTSAATMAAVLIAATCAPASGGSIWARGTARTQNLYRDDTARSVGDILTIVISEKTKIENETNRKLDKASSAAGKMDGTLDLANLIGEVGKSIFDFPKLDFSASASNKFEGKADYGSDRSVTDKISVVVEDVLPNGNLVVLGTRTRNIDGDVQVIQISGLARPSDISYANEVSSEKVADFHIVYKARGQEDLFTHPGWLARALNALNPF